MCIRVIWHTDDAPSLLVSACAQCSSQRYICCITSPRGVSDPLAFAFKPSISLRRPRALPKAPPLRGVWFEKDPAGEPIGSVGIEIWRDGPAGVEAIAFTAPSLWRRTPPPPPPAPFRPARPPPPPTASSSSVASSSRAAAGTGGRSSTQRALRVSELCLLAQ